jgi:hypothetical protein
VEVVALVATIDATVAKDTNVEIILTRSVCYGVCPDYSVTILGDGTVTYVGNKFVAKHGRVADRVAPAEVEALVRQLDRAHFDALVVPDPCPQGMVTDNATNVITLRRNGHEHIVHHYLGNRCAPKGLDALADAIDATANTARWVRCGKGPDAYCEKP